MAMDGGRRHRVSFLRAIDGGVMPSARICAGDGDVRTGTEALVQFPDGTSRLALEHRVRPTARARLLVLSRLSQAGGLPSLLMRLRADGHERLRIVGPEGCARMVDAVDGSGVVRLMPAHPALALVDVSSAASLAGMPTGDERLVNGRTSSTARVRPGCFGDMLLKEERMEVACWMPPAAPPR